MDSLDTKIGYVFQNHALRTQALTHASVSDASYERLEFLGDRVLSLVLADLLYKAFPHEAEGDLAKRLAYLASAECISTIALSLGLDGYGTVYGSSKSQKSKKLLTDLCEGLIGAIYLDGGYGAAYGFVERFWRGLVACDTSPPQDSKSMLQEWLQARGKDLPQYVLEEKTGPEHQAHFKVSLTIEPIGKLFGEGKTVRLAEKDVAAQMLEKLKISKLRD